EGVGGDEGALLREMMAKQLAQGLVEEVGCGMVLPDGLPARVVDLERERRAGLERALLQHAEMHAQIARLLLGVGYAQQHAVRAHGTGIADLTARLGIERRLIEDNR